MPDRYKVFPKLLYAHGNKKKIKNSKSKSDRLKTSKKAEKKKYEQSHKLLAREHHEENCTKPGFSM